MYHTYKMMRAYIIIIQLLLSNLSFARESRPKSHEGVFRKSRVAHTWVNSVHFSSVQLQQRISTWGYQDCDE